MNVIKQNILTLILAGGKGERLYPLTRDRSKPAVPMGGLYRIIDFTLSNCINSGLRRIYVLTQYKSHSLDRHLKLGWNIFSSELEEYLYAVPPQQRISSKWYQGTADAIFQNIYILEREKPSHVLLLSGDHVYNMNYEWMIREHLETGADVTVSTYTVPLTEAYRFGVLEANGEGRIVSFLEKPKDPKPAPGSTDSCLVNMGVYLFDTDVLVRAVSKDARRDTAHDFGKNIIPDLLSKSAKLQAFSMEKCFDEGEAYWRDIGTLDSYYEANMDLLGSNPVFSIYDQEWRLRTFPRQIPPIKTVPGDTEGHRKSGEVLNSIISGGCLIRGGKVVHSVLSPWVMIDSGSLVEESILMDGVEIARGAKVKKAIIDKGVYIPENFRLGYDHEKDSKLFTVTEGGVTVVPKETIIDEKELAKAHFYYRRGRIGRTNRLGSSPSS